MPSFPVSHTLHLIYNRKFILTSHPGYRYDVKQSPSPAQVPGNFSIKSLKVTTVFTGPSCKMITGLFLFPRQELSSVLLQTL